MSERAKLLRRYAANYEEMFAAFNKALDTDPDYATGGPKSQQTITAKSWPKSEIAWAKQTFKGNNAWITWWLRWARLSVEKKWTPELFQRDLKAMQAKNPKVSEGDVALGGEFAYTDHTTFEHLMATPAPELAAYRPEFKTIPTVKMEMGTIERTWQEEQAEKARSLKPKDGDEIVIQFPDGWAWWKLNRHRCDEESAAMGHCGNGGSGDTSQRVLSLRQSKPDGGWSPHLTFILEGNGFLGEMKGRNNDKPVQRYHKYILALLENPIVQGIQGGGYMPSHNFAVTDLTPEEQEALYEKRPELMPISVYYKKFGADDTFVQKVTSYFKGDHDETVTWDAEQKKFITETWPDLKSLIKEMGNDDTKHVMAVLNGDEDSFSDSGLSREEEAKQVLEELPSGQLDKIGRIVIHDKDEDVRQWFENRGDDPDEYAFDTTDVDDILSFIDEMGDDTDLVDAASSAYTDGYRTGTEGQMYKAFERAINDSEFHQVDMNDFWDGQYAEMMAPDAIMELIENDNSLDDYHRYHEDRDINMRQPYNGWSDYDEKAAIERFDEEYDIDKKFAEALGPEGVAAFEQEKALEQQYKDERSRLRDDIYAKFKDASPQVKEEVNKADREFRSGNYEPLVKMVQAVIPDAFPFANAQAEQPQPDPVPA